MTARSFVFPLAMMVGMLTFALGLCHMKDVGRAEAHDVLLRHEATLAGSSTVEHPYRALYAAESPPTEPDPDLVVKLWRQGALLQAIIVGIYLLGGLAMKLDKKHAFYIAVGLGFIGTLVPIATSGQTPTLNSVIGALMVAWAIWVKGPGAQPAPVPVEAK